MICSQPSPSPDFPEMRRAPPKITKLTHNSVQLTWFPASPGYANYTVETLIHHDGFKDKAKWRPILEDIPETTVLIENVEPDKEHTFRVLASTIFGKSDPTKTVSVPIRAGENCFAVSVLRRMSFSYQ